MLQTHTRQRCFQRPSDRTTPTPVRILLAGEEPHDGPVSGEDTELHQVSEHTQKLQQELLMRKSRDALSFTPWTGNETCWGLWCKRRVLTPKLLFGLFYLQLLLALTVVHQLLEVDVRHQLKEGQQTGHVLSLPTGDRGRSQSPSSRKWRSKRRSRGGRPKTHLSFQPSDGLSAS